MAKPHEHTSKASRESKISSLARAHNGLIHTAGVIPTMLALSITFSSFLGVYVSVCLLLLLPILVDGKKKCVSEVWSTTHAFDGHTKAKL